MYVCIDVCMWIHEGGRYTPSPIAFLCILGQCIYMLMYICKRQIFRKNTIFSVDDMMMFFSYMHFFHICINFLSCQQISILDQCILSLILGQCILSLILGQLSLFSAFYVCCILGQCILCQWRGKSKIRKRKISRERRRRRRRRRGEEEEEEEEKKRRRRRNRGASSPFFSPLFFLLLLNFYRERGCRGSPRGRGSGTRVEGRGSLRGQGSKVSGSRVPIVSKY